MFTMWSFLLLSVLVTKAAAYISCNIPENAQVIDPKSFLVLPNVLPPSQANATTVCI